jgi:hypothetical protein
VPALRALCIRFEPKQMTEPAGATGQRTTVAQRHTIVETDRDYGQKAEVYDCARR